MKYTTIAFLVDWSSAKFIFLYIKTIAITLVNSEELLNEASVKLFYLKLNIMKKMHI